MYQGKLRFVFGKEQESRVVVAPGNRLNVINCVSVSVCVLSFFESTNQTYHNKDSLILLK